jgi:hypothetical protein
MDTHPVDPVALVVGLLVGLSGLAILADRQWEDADVTALSAAAVMLIGLLLAGMIVVRLVAGGTEQDEPVDESGPADEE